MLKTSVGTRSYVTSITTTKIVRPTGRTSSRNFYLEDEDIGSSDYEGQANLRDDFKNKSKDMHEKVIAYDHLKAFSLYLKNMPAELAAYRKFLCRCLQ